MKNGHNKNPQTVDCGKTVSKIVFKEWMEHFIFNIFTFMS